MSKLLITVFLVLAIAIGFLSVPFSEARASGVNWEQKAMVLQGEQTSYVWSNSDGDDIIYDCRPYYGTHIITSNIYSGMWKDLRNKGVGCGMIVYYEVVFSWGSAQYTLDFEHTVSPDTGRRGIVGWRSGLDLAYDFVEYAYLGTFVWGSTATPWKPRLAWVLDVIPPTMVKFRYDPQTPTYCEYWDTCP